MQVYYIGLLKLAQAGYVGTGVGYVYLEEMLAREVCMEEYDEALPQKPPLHEQLVWRGHDGYQVCLLVAHQHLGLYPVVFQGFHQAVGSHGCTARLLACVYYKNSHGCVVMWLAGGRRMPRPCRRRGRRPPVVDANVIKISESEAPCDYYFHHF